MVTPDNVYSYPSKEPQCCVVGALTAQQRHVWKSSGFDSCRLFSAPYTIQISAGLDNHSVLVLTTAPELVKYAPAAKKIMLSPHIEKPPENLVLSDLCKLIDVATTYALAAHSEAKQARTMSHVIRVRDACPVAYQPIAVLHDTLEDTSRTERDLRQLFPAWVVDRLVLLSHAKTTDYDTYIADVAADHIALSVKWQDNKDNLRDIEPGHKRDKYLLARQLMRIYAAVRHPGEISM